ncbi:MAG: hypothetical protein IKO01_09130 [Kiritimatiellae bacterium]|nr:hypothetical protein [Kiritimatiellia bacterium]
MKTRLDRRIRLELEKLKARRYLRTVPYGDLLAEDPAAIGRRARTRVPCSCWMCGNPRRFGGSDRLTMQERRFALASCE